MHNVDSAGQSQSFTGLWRNAECVIRSAGQSVPTVRSQITRVALPLTAVLLWGTTLA